VIAFLAAAATAAAAAFATPAATAVPLAPDAVLAKYRSALAAVNEPRVFTVEYALEQTGTRVLDQRHRIFRSGGNERDETLAVNGKGSATPVVRIFRGRPYRYAVSRLAPKPDAYDFVYVGPHKSGKHLDYVFLLVPKTPAKAFTLKDVTIDGVTFLPSAVAFATGQHAGAGSVTFTKSDRWWVASGATASAHVPGGVARERLTFSRWRFPPALPSSTFAVPRPLLTPPPVLP
jgi:hypothetical protein